MLKGLNRRYITAFLLFICCFCLLMLAIHYSVASLKLNRHIGALFLLFSLSTLIMHGFLSPKTQAVLIRAVMLTNTVKLFVYLAILVVYFLLYRQQAKHFAIWFLIHYVCFMVFETISLMRIQHKA